MDRQAKWVMCMVCGGVIYGGPGFHPIPRECECGATVVVPLETHGSVRWDQQKYAAGAKKQAERTRRKIIQEAEDKVIEEFKARRGPHFKWDDPTLEDALQLARRNAEGPANMAAQYELDHFPTQPEVEWTQPGEVLEPHIPAAPPITIDAIYNQHMERRKALPEGMDL